LDSAARKRNHLSLPLEKAVIEGGIIEQTA
jgi:hypothetical protein